MKVRNFWVKGESGYRLPNGEWQRERVFGGGPRRILGEIRLEIFQRTSGEDYGAQRILLAEGLAEVGGRLIFRVLDPNGRVVWKSITHRDGVYLGE